MTVLDALRALFPKSLFTHLGEQPNVVDIPARIATLIRAREEESERRGENLPRKIHPAWFVVLGTVLLALVVLTWILAVP